MPLLPIGRRAEERFSSEWHGLAVLPSLHSQSCCIVVTIVGLQHRKQLTTTHSTLGPTNAQTPAVNMQASGHVLTLSTHYACRIFNFPICTILLCSGCHGQYQGSEEDIKCHGEIR